MKLLLIPLLLLSGCVSYSPGGRVTVPVNISLTSPSGLMDPEVRR